MHGLQPEGRSVRLPLLQCKAVMTALRTWSSLRQQTPFLLMLRLLNVKKASKMVRPDRTRAIAPANWR